LPCDYEAINTLVRKLKNVFVPVTENQKKLGRILVLSDSAHSFGGSVAGVKTGALTDVSVFSFHAVKNLSTAEGGAVALNLPMPFDNEEEYRRLCVSTLHGQNKDALAKTQKGNWKYDIVEAGYKCNMTDLTAAIGLVELERYENDTLRKREEIVNTYNALFFEDSKLQLPVFKKERRISSFHLYPLRVKNITEAQRDAIIQEIFNQDVSVNVHFIPVPSTSFYKSLGYDANNYPVALDNFRREISLPVYYDLSAEQIKTVVAAVKQAINKVLI
jgi:dTDP-4-amino-4,6-dideoxygalactose transaminase